MSFMPTQSLALGLGFEDLLADNQDEIEAGQDLLSEPLSDNTSLLSPQLAKIEAWHSRMTTLLADSEAYLDLAEHQELMSIDRDLTVLERDAILNAKVVHHRRLRNIIQGLVDSMKNKLILGMSLGKRNIGEQSRW